MSGIHNDISYYNSISYEQNQSIKFNIPHISRSLSPTLSTYTQTYPQPVYSHMLTFHWC